jgi:hypothetical protein
MLIGAEKGGEVETYACGYEKRTKRAELSAPFDIRFNRILHDGKGCHSGNVGLNGSEA